MDSQLVGIDLGFGFLKLVSHYGVFKIPSYVGPGSKRKFKLNEWKALNDRLNNIHVLINDKEWFVGNLAIQQRKGSFIFDENRLSKEETKAALLSCLALMNDVSGLDLPFKIMTGLPLSHYDDSNLVESYKSDLLGEHEITLLDKETPITKKVSVSEINVLPQGIGAFFNMVLDEKGKYRNDFVPGTYALIDQGYRTLDYMVLENFEMVEKLSNTFEEMGVKDILNEFKVELRKKYGNNAFSLSDSDLINIIENEYIEIRGERYDLSSDLDELYKYHATNIYNKLQTEWRSFNFKTVYLTGGIAEKLEKHLPFKNLRITKGDFHSQFANAEGFFKLGLIDSMEGS